MMEPALPIRSLVLLIIFLTSLLGWQPLVSAGKWPEFQQVTLRINTAVQFGF